jgi:transposase
MSLKRGQEYSQDLRDRVLAGEGSIREVAVRLSVSPSYVSKATSRLRRTGQRTTKRRGGQRPAILAGREELLRAQLETVKDMTLEELRSWLQQAHGIRISMGALWNTLERMGLRFKKKRARHGAGAPGRSGRARGLARSATEA